MRASLDAADEARRRGRGSDEARQRRPGGRARRRPARSPPPPRPWPTRSGPRPAGAVRPSTTASSRPPTEVAAARQRAIDEASARVGEIVFDLVTKVVGREVDQASHQDLVDEAVAALHAEAQRGVAS